MSNYLKQQLRAHIFRTATFAKPAHLWIGLFTSSPTDAGTGTEVSGGAYARVQRDPSDANWTAASPTNGETDNAAAVTFPAPVGADWGVIGWIGIFDAGPTGGNLLIWGELAIHKTVNDGDAAPSFGVDALQIIFD
jgi:hypothetical protein